MSKQIVVIHGGNAFDTYEKYLKHLKKKIVTIERLKSRDWKDILQDSLGDYYDVLSPRMPNNQNAKYLEWKIWFKKLIPLLQESVVLIGHSLGGIFLAKYLSENIFPKKIEATFLVAAPYNTKDEHPLADFIITNNLKKFEKQSEEIFLYHSKDDAVVRFKNSEMYKKALPKAHLRIFENRGHFIDERFPELVEDIKAL